MNSQRLTISEPEDDVVEVLLLAPDPGWQLRLEVDREPAETRDPVGQVDRQDDGWKVDGSVKKGRTSKCLTWKTPKNLPVTFRMTFSMRTKCFCW